MTKMTIIKEFRQWRAERKKRLQMLKGNREYLWNCFLDFDGLQELFDRLETAPDITVTLFSLDGTRIEIKHQRQPLRQKERINWDHE